MTSAAEGMAPAGPTHSCRRSRGEGRIINTRHVTRCERNGVASTILRAPPAAPGRALLNYCVLVHCVLGPRERDIEREHQVFALAPVNNKCPTRGTGLSTLHSGSLTSRPDAARTPAPLFQVCPPPPAKHCGGRWRTGRGGRENVPAAAESSAVRANATRSIRRKGPPG